MKVKLPYKHIILSLLWWQIFLNNVLQQNKKTQLYNISKSEFFEMQLF